MQARLRASCVLPALVLSSTLLAACGGDGGAVAAAAGAAGSSGGLGGASGTGGAGIAGMGIAGMGAAGTGAAGTGNAASGGNAGSGATGVGGSGGADAGAAGSSGAAGAPTTAMEVYPLPPPDTTPAFTKFEVTWKSTTVLLPPSILGALPDPTPKDAVMRFPPPAPAELAAVTPGQMIVVEGLGLFRVNDVFTDDAGSLALAVSDGALMDAVDFADIAFDVPVGDADGYSNLEAPDSPVPAGWMNQTPGPAELEGTVGAYKLKMTSTRTGPDLTMAFEGGRDPDAGGAFFKFKSSVTMRNVRAVGAYHYDGSSPPTGAVGLRGAIRGTIDYSLASLNGGAKLKLPLKYTLPFPLGPIPMYVAFSPSLEANSTIEIKGDASQGTAFFAWDGDAGFNFGATGPSPAGTSASNGQVQTAQWVATVTTGVGLVGELRADVGAGVNLPLVGGYFDPAGAYVGPVASEIATHASVYAKMKSELVANMDIKPQPAPAPAKSCLTAAANVGVYVGGEVQLFSVPFTDEKQIWGKTYPSQKKGDGCM